MNKIHLPSIRHKKIKKKRVDSTKEDLHLLGQLYIALQSREGNTDRLFEVENADAPPSLSKNGTLRSGQKSDLVTCLETDTPSEFVEADAVLIDGACMVHILRPDASIKTFQDYAVKKVIPFIEKHLATAKRLDVIWDRYITGSLKTTTRETRGAGVRQRMPTNGNGKLPKNWNSYLRNETNKAELFQYLSRTIAQFIFQEEKVVITTFEGNVLHNAEPCDDDPVIRTEYPLSPCNHEEFDTRVMLHAANAVSQGYKRILVIANDTDVIVLGISFFTEIGAEKLWVSFGMGKTFRYISVHDICSTMSITKARALPAFHALTGCDNTSFFSGTGKKSAYGKWSTRPELTTALCHLMEMPLTLSADDVDVIESFVVSLYSVTCTLTDVNQARQQMFAQSSRTFEYLPPTKAALLEHIKRTTYQAGFVWGQSLQPEQVLPSPCSWGMGRVWVWLATVMDTVTSCSESPGRAGQLSMHH